MATRTSRAATEARSEILETLKDDHKRVKKAYRDFQKLDAEADPEACAAVVQQVVADLSLHAALEEELLYPAAREALDEADLIDEAEVEHESMHILLDQLREMSPGDEKFAARFTVLCEYVLHHVKEEEGEMFPALEKAKKLDWEGLLATMQARRAELSGSEEALEEEAEPSATEALEGGQSDDDDGRPRNPGRR